MSNKKSTFIKFVKVIFIVILVIFFSCLIYYFAVTSNDNLDVNKLPLGNNNIKIFDKNGKDISALYYSNNITPNNIPDNIKLAFLVTEDREFYSHNGINYKRLVSALINNIKNANLSQGGSTITQQLIKNTHLSQDKNINRKLKEFKIAKQLENMFSKDEILSMYFNIIYFGNGIYGINDASKVFFNKTPQELNLAEASMLAGVVKNPSKYSPLINYNNASKRKDLILNLLYKTNNIDNKTLKNMQNYKINITNSKNIINYISSYINSAIYEAKLLVNSDNNTKLPKGTSIYTNLDLQVQKNVNDIVSNKIFAPKNCNNHYPNNAIIVLDNNSNIVAFSSDYKQNVFSVNRQIGSLAKPFVSYLPALENNLINIATPILDEKININGYSPNNYKGVFHGYTNMRESLAHSYNIPAVKMLNKLGVNKSKEFLNKININFTKEDNLAMALGGFTNGENLVNIAGAYNMLTNYGNYTKPTFIDKIIINNKEIYNKKHANKVATSDNSYLITDCLLDTAKYGTGKKLSTLPYNVACKTGTVASKNGNSDSYSACYTTSNTIVSWQGNLSNNKEYDLSPNNTGGSYPTNQVYTLLNNMYKNNFPKDFVIPSSIVYKNIDIIDLEKNHKVTLVNDEFTGVLSKKEIFSNNNLPPESNLINEVKKYDISINNNLSNITININSNKLVNFEIYKYNLFGKKLLYTTNNIFNINDKNYIIINNFTDENNNKLIKYNYLVKPFIINELNQKIFFDDFYIKIQ